MSVGKSAETRLVGSDLLGLEFSKALYAFAAREQIKVASALDGSRSGYDFLQAGRADIGLLSLPLGPEPNGAIYADVSFAWHRVVVVVPTSTPLDRISLTQLAAIFGADAPLTYHRWGDLGLKGDWAGSPITAHVPSAGLGLAAEHFRHVILDGRAFKAEVGRFTSAPDMARRLAGDSRAIAVAAAPPADSSTVKILAVARRADQAAHLPTVENFRSGKYPLGVPIRIIVRRDAVGRLRPLLRFLLSDEAAVALGHADLLAESADFRREQVRRLEEM